MQDNINQKVTFQSRQKSCFQNIFKKSISNITVKYKVFLVYHSEVPNRRADRNKHAVLEKKITLPAFLLSKSLNKQVGIFRLLHEKLQTGWKENLKNLSEHALLLGTSE